MTSRDSSDRVRRPGTHAAMRHFMLACAALALAVFSVACSKASLTGPSDANGQPQASIAVRVSGSPFGGVPAMLVTFSQLAVRRDSGEWVALTFANGATRTCDLTRLAGPSDALAVGAVAAGHFNALRVEVSSATLYFDKATIGPACAAAIEAPAGRKATVQLTSRQVLVDHRFSVGPSATTLTVMVDGDQSITKTDARFDTGAGDSVQRFPTMPGAVYTMTPVIRVIG
jgi:hypothetical protein